MATAVVQAACHADKQPASGVWHQAVAVVSPAQQPVFSPPVTNQAKPQSSTEITDSSSSLALQGSERLRQTVSGRSTTDSSGGFERQYHLPEVAYEQRPLYSNNTYYGGSVTLSQATAPTNNFAMETIPRTASPHTEREAVTTANANVGSQSAGGGVISRKLETSTTPVANTTTALPNTKQEIASRSGTAEPATISNTVTAKLNPSDQQPSLRSTGETVAAKEKITEDYKVATQSATFEMTSKLSGEGILGSAVEPVVLPSFGALFITLFGQAETFEKLSPRNLDYSVWFLEGHNEQYEKMATARYFLKKVFLPDTKLPTVAECVEEKLSSGRLEVTCQGKLPQANGQMLRLIVCGKPNSEVLEQHSGKSDQPLADFIDRAYIQGDQRLIDLDLCSERRYVDYVFKGADMQIRFPLELDKVYFLSQFPRDYLAKVETYGEPVPNHLGIHNRTYTTSKAMGDFLLNSRIVQVVIAASQAETKTYGAKPDQKHFNFSYTRKDSGLEKSSRLPTVVPNKVYCQSFFDWEDTYTDKELELFRLINQQRSQRTDCGEEGSFEAAPPLSIDPSLLCAARRHSIDMAEQDFFSHYNLLGQSEWERILIASMQPITSEPDDASRAVFPITGENIAKGSADPAVALKEWLGSDGHCANLMNPIFTHMGTGVYGETSDNPFMTLTLGTEWK